MIRIQSKDIAKLDRAIRALRNSTAKGVKQQIFLHDSLKPIDQVVRCITKTNQNQ